MFKTLKEAVAWIESQPKFRPKTSLEYVGYAYDVLNINLENIKKVHVAGTNGKGSTTAYISYIAMAHGLSVGTYTSPYLTKFNERMRMDMQPISDEELFSYIRWIYKENYSKKLELSFFELTTMIAFKYFSDQKVDLIVIEVGLGGRLDATNILNYDVSLITNIGFDHMKQLGYTLESIAYNKLGILKEKGHLITTVDNKLYEQFTLDAQSKQVTYQFISSNNYYMENGHMMYQNCAYELPLLGVHQMDNAVLAIEAFKYLYPKSIAEKVVLGIKHTKWPGRLEEILPKVYIDGAHNEHAIKALIDTIHMTFKDKNVYVIFSALADKNPENMIKLLKPHVKEIIATSFKDARFESLEPLAKALAIQYQPNFKAALSSFLKHQHVNDVLIITGSLHFAGYVKTLM